MAEKAATHGMGVLQFTNAGQGYSIIEQMMEASTVLPGLLPAGSVLASSGVPITPGLEHVETLYKQQQTILNQQRTLAAQHREIRRLQRIIASLSQELATASSAAIRAEEDLELDYSGMEAQAHLRAPSGVDWKTASRPKLYSEVMDIRYDPDAEER